MTKVTKAVIMAAGYGTRMLPITRTVSKEILPLVDKPIIQVVVEELVEAGITDIIMVTAAHKTDLVDYFSDANAGLVQYLRAAGPAKAAQADAIEAMNSLANIAFIEQRRGVYGTGTPVLDAEPYLGGEPFILEYADDFFIGQPNSWRQLMEVYERYGAPVQASIRRTAPQDYSRYGYAGGSELAPGVVDIQAIVEQPGSREAAPGDLAAVGGFIVTPDVFPYLRQELAELPAGKELQFNAALKRMLADGKQVIAKEITGLEYFDTGNKLEYMKAAVAMAAKHPEIGADFRQFLNDFTHKETSS